MGGGETARRLSAAIDFKLFRMSSNVDLWKVIVSQRPTAPLGINDEADRHALE
jgi:hypothetical protein